jgi:hypothetical protein
VPLIQPQNSWTQRLATFIHVDHRPALGSQGYSGDAVLAHAGLLPQTLAGLAQRLPKNLGMLFG